MRRFSIGTVNPKSWETSKSRQDPKTAPGFQRPVVAEQPYNQQYEEPEWQANLDTWKSRRKSLLEVPKFVSELARTNNCENINGNGDGTSANCLKHMLPKDKEAVVENEKTEDFDISTTPPNGVALKLLEEALEDVVRTPMKNGATKTEKKAVSEAITVTRPIVPPQLLKPPRRNRFRLSVDSANTRDASGTEFVAIGQVKPRDCSKGGEKSSGAEPSRSGGPDVAVVVPKAMCAHCGGDLGENKAMKIEKLRLYFHVACFKCTACGIVLGNGSVGTEVLVRYSKLHCRACFEADSKVATW